ncbi:MAG: PepSY domain-containing protein [Tannerella sp.]|jgi:uncharacterized iron-regulated membrane protein|nr:PepSY domain-containing protein [Tannerella sp.]
MKKIFTAIHLWLSVPFGLIITLVCFSGAMLVFEPEITEWSHPVRYFIAEVKGDPLPVAQLIETVAERIPDTLSIASVQVSSDPKRTYRISFAGQRTAAVYVNQYTGEITDMNIAPQQTFFTVMTRLHRWLLGSFRRDGSFSLGKTAVGISTLMFVFILIAGIVIWIPRTKKAFRRRLTVKTKYGVARFLHDLHVAGGIYAAVILLALSLTGLTYSFSWYRNGFYRVFGADIPQMMQRGDAPAPPSTDAAASAGLRGGDGGRSIEGSQFAGSDGGRSGGGRQFAGGDGGRSGVGRPVGIEGGGRRGGGRPVGGGGRGGEGRLSGEAGQSVAIINFHQWQKVIDSLKKQYTDYRIITIQDGRASVSLSEYGNGRASDTFIFDQKTGDITESSYYRDADKTGKLRGWIYSIHTGSWGGTVTRILTFLAALLGASLPLTGYYIWIKRLLKKA